MGSTAATSGFLVLFLFVSVVQSRDVLTYISAQICAMRGSTVDIRVKRQSVSVEKILWFTDMQDEEPVDLRTDSEYADRVKYFCDMTTCTLRITDLRESDSAEYKFRLKDRHMRNFTGLPGVTLSVTDPDLQMKVTRSYSSWAELFCHSACHLPDRPSYVWYKNGQKIQTETPSYLDYADPADSFSCAVRGQEDFPSPSVCVDGHTCNRVTYTDRSICAAEGSSVDVSSTYNSYKDDVESKFWFSPERRNQWKNPSQPEDLSEDWQYAGRVQVFETERGRSTLRISDLRQSDAAQYHFKFKTPRFEWRSDLPGTTLTVTGLQVQVIRKTVRPSHTEAQLLCQNSCSPPGHFSFVWFKNGQRIMAEETSTYTDSFYPRDNISCALKGHEDARSLSLNAPKVPSVSVSPPGEITEGSSVTLTCDANTAANYTWYEKNLKLLSKKQQLVFSSIQISDSGEYYCTAEDELGTTTSESIFIDVKYAPVVLSVSVSPSEIEEGSSVTLSCSSDANPAANYTWYKENQTLVQGPDGIHHVTSIRSEDSGIYHCKSENPHGQISSTSVFIDVQYAPKRPSVSVSPSEIEEGSSVTLSCSSDANPAANYTWYKENQTLVQGPDGIHHVTSIRSEDSGIYHCKSENPHGQISSTSVFIDVQYAPKRPSVSVSPSAEIEEGSSVTLNCSSDANPAANYTWYKENQTLVQGPDGIHHVTSIRSEDSGIYHCKSENPHGQISSTSVFIDVQYAPKRPSVSVSPSEIEEGSSVTLNCSSDANPAANYTWYKEDEESPKASGQIFTITDFRAEHSGNYYCEAENNRGRQSSTLHLLVLAGASRSNFGIILLFSMMIVAIFYVYLRIRLPYLFRRRRRRQNSKASGAAHHEPYGPRAPSRGTR